MGACVCAQIDVLITGYDESSYQAKIQLYNSGSETYHDIRLKIGDIDHGAVVDTLASKNSIILYQMVKPELNHFIVSTQEATFEKDITPALSAVPEKKSNYSGPTTTSTAEKNKAHIEEAQYEREIRAQVLKDRALQKVQEIRQQAQDEIDQEQSKNKFKYWYMAGLSVIILLIVITIIFIRVKRGKVI
jgi:hypothetical protein